MQINKAILRNSEIVIFDKKNNFAATQVGFFFPIRWIGSSFFFFHVGPKNICMINQWKVKYNTFTTYCKSQKCDKVILGETLYLSWNTLSSTLNN